MDIADAQRDVRTIYAGGFHGQLVSGAIWLLAAGASVVVSHVTGIVVLLTFGAAILQHRSHHRAGSVTPR